MSAPLVSVSGVRGIVGESFTPEFVRRWVAAFALQVSVGNVGRTIVIGRDSRSSGAWAESAALEALQSAGVQPVLLGVVPTPTVQLAAPYHRAAGGLIITGSHNPAEWNALKFLGPDGVFLSHGKVRALQQAAERLDAQGSAIIHDSNSAILRDDRSIERHVEAVLRLAFDVPRIRERHFRVVVDPVNGAGGKAVKPLLEELGCKVLMINGEPTGNFSHPPEPTPAHLTGLAEKVKTAGADLGVAVDPDADRLVLVDERGEVLSEEYTVTLAVLSVLGSGQWAVGSSERAVVVNLSTTRMVDEAAKQFGLSVVRTPVGERWVVEGMRAHGGVIGGEGNGGVIYPECHEGRDSLVGIALVLDLLARENSGLSALVGTLPQYVMKKEKLPSNDTWDSARVAQMFSQAFPTGKLSTLDGIRVDMEDGWVHLRPSNTEPVIRLIGEAQTTDALHQLLQAVRAAISVPA